jgi:ATP-binding cassette subfamily B protein
MTKIASFLGMRHDGRRFLIPEVVQSSMMDCGPAALKALLAGFNIQVHYDRLREACQTDVDGTSIDTLEDLAVQLGLDAVQVMLPADHLFLVSAEALPALVVVRQPNGFTHFIVLWRLHGGWAQILDPGTGRHWLRIEQLKQRLYLHQQNIAVEDWQEWLKSPAFCEPLQERLVLLCGDPAWSADIVEEARAAQGWQKLAALDAAVRMTQSLVQAKGVARGSKAGLLAQQLAWQPEKIPLLYWSARKAPEDSISVTIQGAVLIHVAGLLEPEEDLGEERELAPDQESGPSSAALRAALNEPPPPSPEQHIASALREDGLLIPLLMLAGVVLAGFSICMEIVMLRSLMEVCQQTRLINQQTETFAAVTLFLCCLLLLEWPLGLVALGLGRRFEVRLRQRFLEKLPKLEDRYFHSRLTSDMIQRAYELQQLQSIPLLGMNFLKMLVHALCITAGLIALYPEGAFLILLTSAANIAFALLSQPLMQEQDMRFRTHTASLSRFYLDSLQGLLPIRSHGAEKALRSEHERLLVDWARAGGEFFRTFEWLTLFGSLLSTGMAIWLVFDYMRSGGGTSNTLILLYWMLLLPNLGRSLAELAQQYPSLRNRLLRLLEPLNAPDASRHWYPADQEENQEEQGESGAGAAVRFEDVSVVLSGQTVLHNLQAELRAGEHLAVVGASGAGKSTLVGLLLGWHRPAEGGAVRVDGRLLQGDFLQQLRRELVWVDPEVQLWNRSFRDNLSYGNDSGDELPPELLSQADLLNVLARLPEGEETLLGENGGLLSGGEGQRVRLGRGMNRSNPRLVILDEPFRGLTRGQRRELLTKARRCWQTATLIFISHDVSDSLGFDRVWMMADGELIEDDHPETLAARPDSAYARLLEQERAVREQVWESADWVRLRIDNGRLRMNQHHDI